MIFDVSRAVLLVAYVFLIQLSGCGGGGGGDSDSGSLDTEISPDDIAEESRAFVSAHFSVGEFDDLDTQGITVKLMIPEDLDLVQNSPSLTLERGTVPISPLAVAPAPRDLVNDVFNESGIERSSHVSGSFLVYVFPIPPSLLDEEDEDGELQLTFDVNGVPAEAVLFGDIDRGAVSSFDVENADFDPESVTEFTVTREGL